MGFPSFNSNNNYDEFALYANDTWSVTDRLKLNLGLRYEYFGPQKKSEPKYDSNFYYSDDNCSVNTSSTPQILTACMRAARPCPPTRARSARCGRTTGTTSPPASALPGTSRRRQDLVRGGYGIGYERNFGNVTFNVLFNPPQYLVAPIDAPTDVPVLPIFTDNQGPFGGVAGVTKPIPAGSLRHVDQNIETAYAHFYSLSLQREIFANTVASVEYTGSTGPQALRSRRPQQARGAARLHRRRHAPARARSPSTAPSTPAATAAQSQYHGVTFGLESRQLGNTGLQFTAKYTLSQAKDNLSSTFSDSVTPTTTSATSTRSTRCWTTATPSSTSGTASSSPASGSCRSSATPRGSPRRSSPAGSSTGSSPPARAIPFTLWDCTNGLALCMRAEDPVGIDKDATGGPATGNPNEFNLLDLSPIVGVGGRVRQPDHWQLRLRALPGRHDQA